VKGVKGAKGEWGGLKKTEKKPEKNGNGLDTI